MLNSGIQNARMNNELSVSTMGALIHDGTLWMPSTEINGLFVGRMSDTNLISVFKQGEFPEPSRKGACKIRTVIEMDDILYFFEAFSSDCWKLEDKKITKVSYYDGVIRRVSGVMKFNDKIWIIPGDFSAPIICYDTKKQNSIKIDWSTDIYEEADKSSVTKAIMYKKYIYFATREPGKILLYRINCESMEVDICKRDELQYVNCLGAYKDHLWIFGKNTKNKTVLLECDICTLTIKRQVELLRIEPPEAPTLPKYIKMHFFHKKIYMIPASSMYIFCFDMESGAEETLEYPEGFEAKQRLFNETQQEENIVYLFPFGSKMLLMLDMISNKMKCIGIQSNGQDYLSIKNQDTLNESINVGLNLLLSKVLPNKSMIDKVSNVGSTIYSELKKK